MSLPSNLPAIAGAKLPQAYEDARSALAACDRVDECREWANKAEALASYARQSEDDALLNHAMRIKARAIDRCGELLRAIKEQPGKRTDIQPAAGTGSRLPSRTEAARNAGLSPRQQATAVQVNSVPREEFERLVESPKPPTVTELAELGKSPARPAPIEVKPLIDLGSRSPKDFAAATRGQGALREFAAFTEGADMAAIVRGSDDRERDAMFRQARAVSEWLQELQNALEE